MLDRELTLDDRDTADTSSRRTMSGKSPRRGPRRRLLAALVVAALAAPGSAAGNGDKGGQVALGGTLEVVIADDRASGRSETRYYLRDAASGRILALDFAQPPAAAWLSGARVTVKGTLADGRLRVSEMRRTPAAE